MIEKILFYQPQILIGSLVGVATAVIGVFVILRKSIFLGITLSQSITVSLILVLLWEIHNELIIHVLGILLFLPIYFLYDQFRFKEAILASGFVLYSALGQILTSIGANVQNYVIVAYFGNILLIPEKQYSNIIFLVLFFALLFIIFYKKILAVSFDKIYSKIIQINVFFIEVVYYFILTAILTISIYFMGSFYTIAHLVIPPLIGIMLTRSLQKAFFLSSIISFVSTIVGFMISLIEIQIQDIVINLPTSSTIILVLCIFLIFLIKKR